MWGYAAARMRPSRTGDAATVPGPALIGPGGRPGADHPPEEQPAGQHFHRDSRPGHRDDAGWDNGVTRRAAIGHGAGALVHPRNAWPAAARRITPGPT